MALLVICVRLAGAKLLTTEPFTPSSIMYNTFFELLPKPSVSFLNDLGNTLSKFLLQAEWSKINPKRNAALIVFMLKTDLIIFFISIKLKCLVN
ncbi:hypothetical protein D3C85_926620 [compost metagenome]